MGGMSATLLACVWLALPGPVLEVGPGKPFATIRAAVDAASPGDTIRVFPASGDGVYRQAAVAVDTPGLTIEAASGHVTLDGKGFEYSGIGRTPRAIFQANPGATRLTIRGFELEHAHNSSHNGAGVRINQANDVTVSDCDIQANDMGIMSNGSDGKPGLGARQMIEFCTIHGNGDRADPGYSHNLYLGGESVTVRHCEIYGSLTGHNLKSRAHFNLIEFNYIHDSANREIDLVDDKETSRANSNAVLIGNLIVKDPECVGNRGVIHFGEDVGGTHNGTIFLIHNTIVTPFLSGVLTLSSAEARAVLRDDVVYNAEQHAADLVSVLHGASLLNVSGSQNWISSCYRLDGTQMEASEQDSQTDLKFVDFSGHDYRVTGGPFELGPMPSYTDGSGRAVAMPALEEPGLRRSAVMGGSIGALDGQ